MQKVFSIDNDHPKREDNSGRYKNSKVYSRWIKGRENNLWVRLNYVDEEGRGPLMIF